MPSGVFPIYSIINYYIFFLIFQAMRDFHTQKHPQPFRRECFQSIQLLTILHCLPCPHLQLRCASLQAVAVQLRLERESTVRLPWSSSGRR